MRERTLRVGREALGEKAFEVGGLRMEAKSGRREEIKRLGDSEIGERALEGGGKRLERQRSGYPRSHRFDSFL